MAWKKNSRGLVGTIIFHSGLIALMIFFGFTAPFPPPDEEGILVNFGTNETGGGYVEPQRQEYTPPIVEKQQEEVVTPPVSDPVEDIPDEAEQEAEDLMTQEMEDAIAVAAQKNKEEHSIFRVTIHDYQQRLKDSGYMDSSARELLNLIDQWINDHICQIDIQLKDYVKK